MNIFVPSSESILLDQRGGPSPPTSAGLKSPTASMQPLFLWSSDACPASPLSPSYLGTFEPLVRFRVPDVVIAEDGLHGRQQHGLCDDSGNSDGDDALVFSYARLEQIDVEQASPRSRWSESESSSCSSSSSSSSSSDGESDYGGGLGCHVSSDGGDASLTSFPALAGNPFAKDTLAVSTKEMGEGQDDGNSAAQHEGVDAVEQEYGRPWGAAVPRWKWLQSSDSLPMYNLGPTDFRHGTSKLRKASSPDDDDDDDDDGDDSAEEPDFDSDSDDSECAIVISPMWLDGVDADAQMEAIWGEVLDVMEVSPV